MPYILALDQGTTSSRAILFDHDARIAGVALDAAFHSAPEVVQSLLG